MNPLLTVNIVTVAGKPCLRVTGMKDNSYSTSNVWYIRMRFYPNANTVSYTSTTYASNGQV